jgi:hypothetical protein
MWLVQFIVLQFVVGVLAVFVTHMLWKFLARKSGLWG